LVLTCHCRAGIDGIGSPTLYWNFALSLGFRDRLREVARDNAAQSMLPNDVRPTALNRATDLNWHYRDALGTAMADLHLVPSRRHLRPPSLLAIAVTLLLQRF